VRKQVALFNLATTATVVIGVLSLYVALFLLALAAAAVLVVPSLFADGLGHPVHPADYLELAWLTSSLATVGGALGAGLESDEAVREAAYTYRPDPATAFDAVGNGRDHPA
jgi:Flp pilus assembly protein TadB